MPRLSFGPCKKKNLQGLFSETKFFAGTKNYKMGPVIMCHVYKSSQKWGQGLFLKTKNFAGTKNNFFFTGTKT